MTILPNQRLVFLRRQPGNNPKGGDDIDVLLLPPDPEVFKYKNADEYIAASVE